MNFELNLEFWAITPAFNLNFNSGEFEIEWLCFGFYFKVLKPKKPRKLYDNPLDYLREKHVNNNQ